MTHFDEARGAVLRSALHPDLAVLSRLCLIWDVQGHLRVLISPAPGVVQADAVAKVESLFATPAGPYWTGEIWVWTEDSTKGEAAVFEKAWEMSRPIQEDDSRRELSRHLSKGAWFGNVQRPPWPLLAQTSPILSFFSFKGGVGRTTALASFAMMLARAGRRVGIIDLDLEAPGAGVLVPAAEPPRYGVVDYLLERRVLAGRDLDIADYYYLADTPEIVGNGPAITVVPAGRLDSDYLEKLARVDYDALLGGAEEPPLHALLRQMKADRELDYILIDSRAGLHDIGGLALNGVAHLDVIFGTATEQSWQGVTVVVEHLGKKRLQAKVQRQDCALVYALAPSVAEKNRGEAVELFRSRAHEIFSDYFYDEEVEAGQPEPEDYWPVPSVDSDDEPHHAVPIGFNIDIMRGESLAAVAPQLLQGDYEMLHKALLARLGRMAP